LVRDQGDEGPGLAGDASGDELDLNVRLVERVPLKELIDRAYQIPDAAVAEPGHVRRHACSRRQKSLPESLALAD
jgi:hypothetical protein